MSNCKKEKVASIMAVASMNGPHHRNDEAIEISAPPKVEISECHIESKSTMSSRKGKNRNKYWLP